MRPSKFTLLFLLFVFINIFSVSAPRVYADTHVSGKIDGNITWTLSNSPYIIDAYAYISSSSSLSIEPGVIVKFAPYAELDMNDGGSLQAVGTSVAKIYFTSLIDDEIGGDTNGDGSTTSPNINDNSTMWQGIYASSSPGSSSDHLFFKNTIIRYAYNGLSVCEFFDVDIQDSIFEKNHNGIDDCGNSHVTISNTKIINNQVGIYLNQADYAPSSVYQINSLSIHDNIDYGVLNETHGPYPVKNWQKPLLWFANLFRPNHALAQENGTYDYTLDFRNTWWGDVSGPMHSSNFNGSGDVVSDYVLFTPWLTSDPFEESSCCSNVLFLPGIKGSVLKKGSDTLWPPTIFSVNDVSQLALTTEGESVNDIHVDGILNKFYSAEIYVPFSNFMDSITGNDKLIKEWLPLAYDWRFSPEEILSDGIKTENETLDVIKEIEKLAEHSKTGKIAIVSHSMGGLLGKAIIKKLDEEGKSNLIDSFIMIGTPQLGTPQAITSILHGDGENILAGFITNPIGIRKIAQNMPSAYNLLSSSKYFDNVSDSVITFNSNALFTKEWRDFWGQSINIYSSFFQFMTGTGVERIKPVEQKLQDPEVLLFELMADAFNFHNTYDNYQFPEHIRVVQIAGWGSPTVKSVEYKNSHGAPSYETLFTVEGDRVVVYPSAISSIADETYYFNIIDYNKAFNSNAQHRDLLSTNTLQNLIQSVTKKEDIINIDFLSTTKPPVTNLSDQLIVSTHSPVILGVHDQLGNFTGIDSNQDLSADILSVSEDIPGSAFLYTSGGQNIFLPKEGNYNFLYKGTGSGLTTVVIENFSADVTTPVASYTDIPTTVNTTANFTVESVDPENTEIQLDINGDGKTKIVKSDDATLSLNELVTLIKEKISILVIKDKVKQNLLKQISNLEKKIENKKQKNLKIINNLENKISRKEIKGKIDSANATEIANLLNILEVQAENIVLDSVILNDLKIKIQSLNIKQNLKNDLLKRIERLENQQGLVRILSNLSKNILKKAEKGKIADTDAQGIINLLNQIESMV